MGLASFMSFLMKEMKKVIFTEAQIRKYLNEEMGDYLDSVKNAGEIPGNAYGTEVFANNLDSDAQTDVTTTDGFMQKRSKSNRLFARSRQCEGRELDNMKTSGFGNKIDNTINQLSNAGGKMINNINNEIQSDKDGMRNNTQEVRLSRMKEYEKNNPNLYQKNGGDFTVKQLEKNVANNSASHQAQVGEKRKTEAIPTITNGEKTHKHSNNDNVYYYSY